MRYVFGHPELGQSPETGFDCSGFVRYVLTKAGLHIPDFIGMDGSIRPIRHANEFFDHFGLLVTTEPEAGDLIFFSRDGTFPTHIGIVQDQKHYVHAPGKDNTKVTISKIEQKEIQPNSKEDRQIYKIDPIGYKAPTRPHSYPTDRYHQQRLE